jgi:hypothetical protein
MIPLTEIFTYVDDFCKIFEDRIKEFAIENSHKIKRNRAFNMSISEILIMFHKVIFNNKERDEESISRCRKEVTTYCEWTGRLSVLT